MRVGRQWVCRLGLLLAAGMVVQVPGLVGVGVRGASAASPTPSYQATLSIDGNCVATVTVTWNYNTKLQSVQFYVRDLTTGETDPSPGTAPNEPVSGKKGMLGHPFKLKQLKPLPATPATQHSFDAFVDLFYSGNSSSLPPQIWAHSQNAPCYLSQLP